MGKDRDNSVGTGISLCLGEQTQFHATAELGLNLFYGDLEQDWIFLKMAMNVQRGGHGVGKARVGGTRAVGDTRMGSGRRPRYEEQQCGVVHKRENEGFTLIP